MASLQKYGFRIRTRNGVVLDNLAVQARDRAEAERRISQIYHHCEILECQEHAAASRPAAGGTADVESVIALINETRELPDPSRDGDHSEVPGPAPGRDDR